MPINDASDPAGAFNFGVDTLGDIERIEVVRGPMAALYGSGAIGGVINLITRKGTRPGLHISGDLAGGYPAQGMGTVNASGITGPWDYSATLEASHQRGYDSTPQRETIYTGTPQRLPRHRRHAQPRLHVRSTARGSRCCCARARRSFGFDNLGYPNFDDDNSRGNDASLLGRLGVHSALFGGTYETGAVHRRPAGRPALTEALNLAGSQSRPARPTAIIGKRHRRAVEQHRAPRRSAEPPGPVRDRSDLRLRVYP